MYVERLLGSILRASISRASSFTMWFFVGIVVYCWTENAGFGYLCAFKKCSAIVVKSCYGLHCYLLGCISLGTLLGTIISLCDICVCKLCLGLLVVWR